MVIYVLLSLVAWLTGTLIRYADLRLLTGNYHFHLGKWQWVTYCLCILAVGLTLWELVRADCCLRLMCCVVFGCCYALSEWGLAKWSPHRIAFSVGYRLTILIGGTLIFAAVGVQLLTPFLLAGFWFRNSPFGTVHGFKLPSQPFACAALSQHSQPNVVNVVERGILPNTGKDVLEQVQALINEVGKAGGGTILFPRGRYHFNMSGQKQFLQINYSHITLEGECDAEGLLLTEFVNGGPTTRGERNPWLSPFFITTGESLQPSNNFWGLQFRNPCGLRTESSSLSDPGSDGTILSPAYATAVISDAPAGTTLLKVEDSSVVGKYILLGMYNTTADGNLIKELLGTDQLRPEWTTALRAGKEQAPSFQWLVEVKQVVDKHTIELCRPLLRDCLLKYEPAIYNAEMLEDVHIRQLCINSRWNGLFRHHGFPLYYSVAQAQEMDYGWNAINMKRVAHSTIEHVEIKNFTNPLYVQDSREVSVTHVDVSGYDGHQGIKVYCHASDCLFQHIHFHCHFADMMGGEGNAYGNTFRDISYSTPLFKPADFDFHGFSEGPMSPPAYNTFEHITGFRYIKGAGAVFMQPACGIGNVWRDIAFYGGRKGASPYYAMSYRVKSGIEKYVTAIGYTLIMLMKRKARSVVQAKTIFIEKLADIDRMGIPQEHHQKFFPGCRVE